MQHRFLLLSLVLAAATAQARAPRAADAGASQAAPAATPVAASHPGTPQRAKMKACNADARTKALHGDERRAFMKQCLSGKSAAPSAS